MGTIAAAVIAAFVTADIEELGGAQPRIGRDFAGDNAAYPFMTFVDPISSANVLMGDRRTWARERRQQWDLWQARDGEVFTLPETICGVLDNFKPTGTFEDLPAGSIIYRFRVVNLSRFYEEREEIVHHAIDVIVTHSV